MFELENFKNILNQTSDLMNKIKECSKEDVEEIQMKINSNMYALKIISSKIDDPESKEIVLKSIENLFGVNDKEISFNNKQNSLNTLNTLNTSNLKDSELIENELLKNTFKLKKMAGDFSQSLKDDKKAMDKLTNRMGANAVESKNSLKILEKSSSNLSSSSIMSMVFIIFIGMYLFIRFL